MAPRLRVLAGTSLTDLVPITDLINTSRPFELSSDVFKGNIVAYIKGLQEDDGTNRDSEYFHREDRSGITWSIQVQGRFLEPLSADDILFGNVFNRPLQLPWGTSAALKFMHFIDPTLEHELASSKPWALSPLISTMPHFAHERLPSDSADAAEPPFPPIESLGDSVKDLHLAVVNEPYSSPSSSTFSASSGGSTPSSSSSSLASVSSTASKGTTGSKSSSARSVARLGKKGSLSNRSHKARISIKPQILELRGASQRQSFFSQKKNRKAVIFGPEDLITTDFCYGFINFLPTLTLQLPVGISFDLMKYWDKQPVRFVCCKRKEEDEIGGDPWGRILWCIAIDLVDDEST